MKTFLRHDFNPRTGRIESKIVQDLMHLFFSCSSTSVLSQQFLNILLSDGFFILLYSYCIYIYIFAFKTENIKVQSL